TRAHGANGANRRIDPLPQALSKYDNYYHKTGCRVVLEGLIIVTKCKFKEEQCHPNYSYLLGPQFF
ncbi:MAG: hypothetical protein ACI909_002597, partial [Planctomycetota bacterium]